MFTNDNMTSIDEELIDLVNNLNSVINQRLVIDSLKTENDNILRQYRLDRLELVRNNYS